MDNTYYKEQREKQKRTVEVKHNVKNFAELQKVITMTKKMIGYREIEEISIEFSIKYFLDQ